MPADVLAARGVALAEYYLLSSVGHHGILTTADGLVTTTQGCVEGDARGNFGRDEYLAALGACIEKGWLCALTEEDCARDRERWASATEPCCDLYDHEPDLIEITQAGHELLVAILAELHPGLRADGHEGTRSVIDGVVEVFAETERGCAASVQTISADPVSYLGDGAEIVAVAPPAPCGPWWASRFIRLQAGFRAVITYRSRASHGAGA